MFSSFQTPKQQEQGDSLLESPKPCSPNINCLFPPSKLRCLFLPFHCSAKPAQHSPQMAGDGCDSSGILGTLHHGAVLVFAIGSIEPGLCAEPATSPKVSHASPLCLLSCSLTALPPALIQWGLEGGLVVLFIMHQSRKQQNQKFSQRFFFFLNSVPSKTMLNYLQNQADASAGLDSQQAGV